MLTLIQNYAYAFDIKISVNCFVYMAINMVCIDLFISSSGLILMSAWVRNHMLTKVWDEIAYPSFIT